MIPCPADELPRRDTAFPLIFQAFFLFGPGVCALPANDVHFGSLFPLFPVKGLCSSMVLSIRSCLLPYSRAWGARQIFPPGLLFGFCCYPPGRQVQFIVGLPIVLFVLTPPLRFLPCVALTPLNRSALSLFAVLITVPFWLAAVLSTRTSHFSAWFLHCQRLSQGKRAPSLCLSVILIPPRLLPPKSAAPSSHSQCLVTFLGPLGGSLFEFSFGRPFPRPVISLLNPPALTVVAPGSF